HLVGEVATPLPVLETNRPLPDRFEQTAWDELEAVLPGYMQRRDLYPATDAITAGPLPDTGAIVEDTVEGWFLTAALTVRSRKNEPLGLPVTFVPEEQLDGLLLPVEIAGLARLAGPDAGVLCQALAVPDCCRPILRTILGGRSLRMGDEEIAATPMQ